jgi:tetratricopeptide (TPR) repeat protein
MRTQRTEEFVTFASAESHANISATNVYGRLSNGDFPPVSREQLESYLTQNRRSVESLLGALRASGDDELLKEAKERFPNDPRVQFAAAFKSDSPEQRQQWLEKFKQSDPENSLANYLLAGEHLKAGQNDQALAELTAATGKRSMENYLVDFIQNAEEAYRAAGYSDAESKAVAGTSALLPEQAKLKQVGVDLVELAKRYQQAGDEPSAQAALQMGLNLAHRLDQSPQVTLIQELVGMAIERKVLDAMNPNASYADTGRTVKEQLDALTARRNSYRELTTKTDPILKTMSDEDLAHYYDRIKLYGDVAALRWVINKSQQQ